MPVAGLTTTLTLFVLVSALVSGVEPPMDHVPVTLAHPTEQEGDGDFPGPSPLAWGLTEGTRAGKRIGDVRVNDADHPRRLASCNTQNETHLVSYGKNVYVGFNDARHCLAGFHPEDPLTWTGFARSTDGGKTFLDKGPLVGNHEIRELWGDPVLAVDTRGRGAGTLYLASLAYNMDGVFTLGVGVSKDSGKTFRWEDAVTDVKSTDGPDKEWLTMDNTGGRFDGNLYLAWTDFGSPSTLKFARSADGGQTWSKPLQLDPGSGFGVRVVVGPDGTVHVVYQKAQVIYWTRSIDGGQDFSPPRHLGYSAAPGAYGTCLRYSLNGHIRTMTNLSAAVDDLGSPQRADSDFNPAYGSLYVTYHAHGDGADEADVFFLKRDSSGRWTKAQRLNDDETTTDQFQPEVAVHGPGRVAVVWTDRREDADLPTPLGNRQMAQYLAVSKDGGLSFSRNRRFSDVLFDPPFAHPNPNITADCYAGDYTGLYSTGNGEVIASWGDNRDALEVTGVTSRIIPDPNVYFRRERL